MDRLLTIFLEDEEAKISRLCRRSGRLCARVGGGRGRLIA